MPPKGKKSKAKEGAGAGRGGRKVKKIPVVGAPPAPQPPVVVVAEVHQAQTEAPQALPTHEGDGDGGKKTTRSRSHSGSSVASVAESLGSVRSERERDEDPSQKKKKRKVRSGWKLSIQQEESMLDFLLENEYLWDIKLTGFRDKAKKARVWEEQADALSTEVDKITVEHLQGWFRSLRDCFTRLDKKKSGDGTPTLTEREKWIKQKFQFLTRIVRHKPEPLMSVSIQIFVHYLHFSKSIYKSINMVTT